MAAQLEGRSLIGFRTGAVTQERFAAVNPATGAQLEPWFHTAPHEEVMEAAELAARSFDVYSHVPGRQRASYLRRIAEGIEALGEDLVERAAAETALSTERIRSERARTCMQLRFFADLVEEGSWVDARIARGDAGRKPLSRPDVRSLNRPLGPTVVFGASNFPLAFSVAGGDTASALAAGNSVVVKAHPAHPGTSELVGRAAVEATRACGLPEGVFSLLFDAGTSVGTALVAHPAIKAGGFTGSRTAGLKLLQIANSRPEPIPFYAEMSSINPVFLLPDAVRQRGEQIAAGLHASFTLGAGQFCTKPGLVFLQAGEPADQLTQLLKQQVTATPQFVLLTQAIHSSYQSGLQARANSARTLAQGGCANTRGSHVAAAIFETDGSAFLAEPNLASEIFGPATLLVRHAGRAQLLGIARALEGQLTATIHGTERDLEEYAELVSILEQRAGRIVYNGFPTGVEVCDAMVHGGPYPATSDVRTTSVGTRAIFRFARPVCFQNFPDSALPAELQNSNPLHIWRTVDGQLTREAIREGISAALP